MQYRTFVIAEVPRVRCKEHGIRQVRVPWSDPGSRFTTLFEALVSDWLMEANVLAIARRLRLSWDQVAGIQKRAVTRGLARRELKPPTQIGVDETSFQKRYEYLWLRNPERMSAEQWLEFGPLRSSRLKVARAWAIKEAAMLLWGYVRRGWEERMWERWYRWAIRSRLQPIKRVARMIKRHWEGVINAATTDVTNARAEAINSRIQWVKKMACGFRNRGSYRYAIYLHLGGLDLYPDALKSAHTKA